MRVGRRSSMRGMKLRGPLPHRARNVLENRQLSIQIWMMACRFRSRMLACWGSSGVPLDSSYVQVLIAHARVLGVPVGLSASRFAFCARCAALRLKVGGRVLGVPVRLSASRFVPCAASQPCVHGFIRFSTPGPKLFSGAWRHCAPSLQEQPSLSHGRIFLSSVMLIFCHVLPSLQMLTFRKSRPAIVAAIFWQVVRTPVGTEGRAPEARPRAASVPPWRRIGLAAC